MSAKCKWLWKHRLMIISHQIGCREIHAPLEHSVESVLQNGFLLIYVPDLQKQIIQIQMLQKLSEQKNLRLYMQYYEETKF